MSRRNAKHECLRQLHAYDVPRPDDLASEVARYMLPARVVIVAVAAAMLAACALGIVLAVAVPRIVDPHSLAAPSDGDVLAWSALAFVVQLPLLAWVVRRRRVRLGRLARDGALVSFANGVSYVGAAHRRRIAVRATPSSKLLVHPDSRYAALVDDGDVMLCRVARGGGPEVPRASVL